MSIRYSKKTFLGERAQFNKSDMIYDSCVFKDGESPLKECEDILCRRCSFEWKYPVWYGTNIVLDHCFWTKDARAGAWYDNGLKIKNSIIEAPKALRKCKNIILENVAFPSGDETLWWNEGIRIKNVKVIGDYFGMKSKDLIVDGLILKGHYSFDGCEDLLIKNSVLDTKDAFWNCKRVRVENSKIVGEYFGWNSEDVALVNCEIWSHQGFCYMKNVKLINCKLIKTDLCFEFCENIDADVTTRIDSIKNPISGRISCRGYGQLIRDPRVIDVTKTKIEVKK